MPALKYITQVISKKVKVVIIGLDKSLGKEIAKQLATTDKIQLVEPSEKFDLLIYLVGFGQHSWSESLSHTSKLTEHLEFTLAAKAKFILVTPAKDTPFIQVAMSLVNQFSRNFNLQSKHVSIDHEASNEEAAEEVLKSFIKGYRYQKMMVPETIEEPAQTKTVKSGGSVRELITIIFLLFVLILVGVGSIYGSLYCVSRFLISCVKVSRGVLWMAQPLVTVFPELRSMATVVERSYQVNRAGDEVKLQADSLFRGLVDHQTQVTTSQLTQYIQSLSRLSEQLAYLQNDLKQGVLSWRQAINKAVLISGDLSKVLGIEKPITFMLLVQDSSELRATGGFLEGVVMGTIDAGKVGDIQIVDTTQADAQLRGQVDPPVDLQKALNETTWLLRDSNWDPDFAATAKRSAWFIQKELGMDPDLVVAVNLEAIRQLLKTIGTLEIPGIGRITSENIWEKELQYYKAQSNTGRFTLTLVEKLLATSQTWDQSQRLKIAVDIQKLFDQRQVMLQGLSFITPGFSQAGWSGQSITPSCKSPYPCLLGGLYAVDSNVGINKVNPYITRQHSLVFQISPDQVEGKYQLTYTSIVPIGVGWPLGTYKNYLRVYIPEQVVVGDVSIGTEVLPTSNYSITLDKGGVVVGMVLEVPPASSQTVTIVFKKLVPKADKFHFQWELLNQPGVAAEPWSVTVDYPSSWLSSSPKTATVATPGVFKYNQLVDSPFRLDIDFVKWKNTP